MWGKVYCPASLCYLFFKVKLAVMPQNGKSLLFTASPAHKAIFFPKEIIKKIVLYITLTDGQWYSVGLMMWWSLCSAVPQTEINRRTPHVDDDRKGERWCHNSQSGALVERGREAVKEGKYFYIMKWGFPSTKPQVIMTLFFIFSLRFLLIFPGISLLFEWFCNILWGH